MNAQKLRRLNAIDIISKIIFHERVARLNELKHAKNIDDDFENRNFKKKNNYHVMSKSSNTLIYSNLTS